MRLARNDLYDMNRPARHKHMHCTECRHAAIVDVEANRNAERHEQHCKRMMQREADERSARLLTILGQKTSWRCTCNSIPKKQKAYHALYHRIHKEHCTLHPSRAGEMRWDGKNNGVSLEDLFSLKDQKKY